MKAVRLTAPRNLRVEDVDLPTLAADDVLVRVLACGICGSDLNAWAGVPGTEYPLAAGGPGHEVWGEIADLGNGVEKSWSHGQRVTGVVASGGFAQYARARAADLVPIPNELGNTLVLGEPLACAANVVRRMRLQTSESLAVVGFGYLAALVIRLLEPVPAGLRWIAVSRRAESRALALSLGAEAAYDFDSVPLEAWDSFPVVLEAAGVQQSLDYASWLTAYGGRLVVAGYHADGPRIVNFQAWNWKGIDVVNAHEREAAAYVRGLEEGLKRIALGELAKEIAGLVTHGWPLERANEAFATVERRPPDYLKGVILPWS